MVFLSDEIYFLCLGSLREEIIALEIKKYSGYRRDTGISASELYFGGEIFLEFCDTITG